MPTPTRESGEREERKCKTFGGCSVEGCNNRIKSMEWKELYENKFGRGSKIDFETRSPEIYNDVRDFIQSEISLAEQHAVEKERQSLVEKVEKLKLPDYVCCYCRKNIDVRIQPWNYEFPSQAYHLGCRSLLNQKHE